MTGIAIFLWGCICGATVTAFVLAMLSMAHEEDDR